MACNSIQILANPSACLSREPVEFVSQIYRVGLELLVGPVALLFLIIGGYLILASRGNTEQLRRGKEYILYTLLGILLAIFGFIFVEAVAGVIKIPGF